MYKAIAVVGLCAAAEAALAASGDAPGADQPSATGAQGSERSSDQSIPEIVVTAQKRTSSAQSTPAAVTVVTSDYLADQGISSPTQLAQAIPAATFTQVQNVVQTYIRGVGSQISKPEVDPAIAYNFNGVYLPREATAGGLFDLEAIEVLYGPQGTLYGRSALGGAINVNAKRPTAELQAIGSLEVGDYHTEHFSGAVNIPVNDVVQTRVAVDVNHHEGYQTNGADALRSAAGRLGVTLKPSEVLSAYVFANYSKSDGTASNAIVHPYVDSGNPWVGPANGPFGSPGQTRRNDRALVTGAEVNLLLNDLTLTYIPSYTRVQIDDLFFVDVIPLGVHERESQMTHELRLSNATGSRLEWVTGLYYYDFHHAPYDLTAAGFPALNLNHSKFDGYAAFAQGTYRLTEHLRLDVGGRFSADQKEASGTQATTGGPFAFSKDWRHGDWKAGLSMDAGASSLLYAAIQTGYIPGAYNEATPTGTPLEPAKLTSYTIGAKNRFLGNSLQVNAEAFYYDYRDFQLSALDAATQLSRYFNADKVRIYGLQLDTEWRPSAVDRFSVGVVYLNAQINQFRLATTDGSVDYAGYQMPAAPDWSVNASFEHEFRLPSGAAVKARADTHFETSSWLEFDHPAGLDQKAFSKSNALLSYLTSSRRFEFGVYVRNIENTAKIGGGATGGPGVGLAFIEPPRTYGIQVRARTQ